MANDIKLALAQLNPTVGDLDGNAAKILTTWKEHDTQSDLIIFPELFLCGYPPEDLTLNRSFLQAIEKTVETLCNDTHELSSAALIPTIWRIDDNIYNAALLIEQGQIKDIVTKSMLPNSNVFDEPRTFSADREAKPVNFRGKKLGIMICEDVWHTHVPIALKEQGAEILIAINGSPFNLHQPNERNKIATACVRETNLPLIYLNMVGGQDELVFDGQSFIMDRQTKVAHHAPAFEGDIISLNLSDRLEVTKGINQAPSTDNWRPLAYKALTLGLKDYIHKNGFKQAIIGLSGGIDSALTAAIAVDALGAENVQCVMLPSDFTSSESLDDAKECAERLGVKYDIIPIKDAVTTLEGLIPNLRGLAHENTQSRIRGTILMALSNMTGAMLITTGNKSEVAVGYCTIYGDMNGGFNALKDVYKTEVYRLSEWRNEQSYVIPKNIITKAPTAELREDQKDQDSLPPYDLLDDILSLLIEYDAQDWNNAPKELLERKKRCEQHPETVKKIAKLLKISEYKRFQSAPGTRITFRAFGRDRRYPMTNSFVNSIEKAD